jgi:hypothetical protein
MKLRIWALTGILALSLGACGKPTQGSQGESGPPGAAGAQGEQGRAGEFILPDLLPREMPC